MCGIAGIICYNPAMNLPVGALKLMSKAMQRRGPEDEGYAFFSNCSGFYAFGSDTAQETINYRSVSQAFHVDQWSQNARVAFVHRRLSIIDLSPQASQPMVSQDSKTWIIFNGEIYNYKEIREQLSAKGYSFKSNSDTEVILYSYKEWGIDFIHRLNGMFAMALYDLGTNQLYLIRDRLGMKPLFYTQQGSVIIFASDIKTLIASELYSPEVDFTGLWNDLCLTVTPAQSTAFKNISSVDQGTFIKVDLNSRDFSVHRYWDIPTGRQNLNMTEPEAVELLSGELKQAVKYCLTADVEIATFMSSGLDSTLVTSFASQMSPHIKAFTLGFENMPDEVPEAIESASTIDVEHKIKKVTANEIVEAAKLVVTCYEEPFVSISPTYLLANFVHDQGIKVVLNGLGGDELFAGYSYYPKYRTVERIRPYKQFIHWFPDFLPRIKKLKQYTQFNTVGQYYAFAMANFKNYELARLTGNNYNPVDTFEKYYDLSALKFTDFVEEISYYDFHLYIGKHQVYRADQFLAYFSMEGRFPFLDHNLIEAMATVPSKYKLHPNGTQKYVLRRLASQYLSKENVNRPKKGFTTPVNFLMDTELKPVVTEKIQALKKRDIFVNSEIDLLMQGYSQNKRKLWQLVMTELWFETFFDQNGVNVTKP